MFWNYEFPGDIASDHSPQFMAQVWKSFFKKLEAAVSLTSGYHPQVSMVRLSATSLMPFKSMCSAINRLSVRSMSRPLMSHKTDNWFKRAERVWRGVHPNIHRAVHRYTKQADKYERETPNVQVDDRVWLSIQNFFYVHIKQENKGIMKGTKKNHIKP